MNALKVSQRVRYVDPDSRSYKQVGTLRDLPTEHCRLVWVQFDDDSYNNAVAIELDDQPNCTTCLDKYLEPIED